MVFIARNSAHSPLVQRQLCPVQHLLQPNELLEGREDGTAEEGVLHSQRAQTLHLAGKMGCCQALCFSTTCVPNDL